MTEAGYKSLITYKIARTAFDLGWDFVPQYYSAYDDGRQRDQIKQALRSHKQNIVEGSSERSLSSKLKLYDVDKSSGMEALEDFEDILRLEDLPRWNRNDPRLTKLRQIFEGYPTPPFPSISPPNPSFPSNPSSDNPSSYVPPNPSVSNVSQTLGIKTNQQITKGKHQPEVEAVANYMIDLLTRNVYLLDKQINAIERKHQQEGGYNEKLLKKRLDYIRKYSP